MKKKLLALVAALALAVPFAPVKAIIAENCDESGICPTYNPGELVNFIVSKEELDSFNGGDLTVGQHVIVLSDAGATDKYVKSLAVAPFLAQGTNREKYNSEVENGIKPGKVLLDAMKDEINSTPDSFKIAGWEYARHTDGKLDIAYPSKDEIIAAWGAQYDGTTDTYKIDMTKVNADFKEELETQIGAYDLVEEADSSRVNYLKKGFFTGDYVEESKKVWVVEFTMDGDKMSGMTLKQVDASEDYAVLAAVYMDKTYDCSERDTKAEYACYECGEEYIWTEKGKQAETCTLVEGKTSKSVCVKNAKTGIEEYIIEFVGVTAICGVALVLAKRKDLFKSI